MKKFYPLMALATALFLSSCSEDEYFGTKTSGEVLVSFNLGIEEGPAMRAISDGKSVNTLYYSIFDANNEELSRIKHTKEENVSFIGGKKVSLTLAKDQKYKVTFWAQSSACKAYTVNEDMVVTVSYEDATNNDESRDAFYKTIDLTVSGNEGVISVPLTRPFAQLNVGVTQTDWEAAKEMTIEIEKSEVTLSGVANTINLVDGTVTGNEEKVTFSAAAIPGENESLTIGENSYKYLSMSYILADAGKSTIYNVSYTFSPKKGNPITLTGGLGSVPVQRNWRTNIVGEFLTGNVDLNIEIDTIYDGDLKGYPYEISSVADWSKIANFLAEDPSATITLTKDLDFSNTSSVTPIENFTGTLDGNGHTIKGITVDGTDFATSLIRKIKPSGMVKNLTLESATVNGYSQPALFVAVNEGTIMGCTIKGGEVTDYWGQGSVVHRNEGLIIACHIEKVNSTYPPGFEGATNPFWSPAGLTADNTNTGLIIACYVKDCTFKGAAYANAADNLASKNNGTLTQCYYVPWTSDNSGVLTGEKTSWDEAMAAMNEAIETYNSSTEGEICEYRWSGTQSDAVVSIP